jgi:hypothetical protein
MHEDVTRIPLLSISFSKRLPISSSHWSHLHSHLFHLPTPVVTATASLVNPHGYKDIPTVGLVIELPEPVAERIPASSTPHAKCVPVDPSVAAVAWNETKAVHSTAGPFFCQEASARGAVKHTRKRTRGSADTCFVLLLVGILNEICVLRCAVNFRIGNR